MIPLKKKNFPSRSYLSSKIVANLKAFFSRNEMSMKGGKKSSGKFNLWFLFEVSHVCNAAVAVVAFDEVTGKKYEQRGRKKKFFFVKIRAMKTERRRQ
jgi:hypothetical protein